jgi:hypothetical protein
MRSLLLLDPESGAAEILEHLDDPAGFRRRREPHPRARRDDHIFLSAYQHGAAVGSGGDHVAGIQGGSARRGRGSAGMLELYRTCHLGDPPERGGGEGGAAREEQHQEEGAQNHGRSLSAAAPKGPGGPA